MKPRKIGKRKRIISRPYFLPSRKVYKWVFTCLYMGDRKRMRKIREKRIEAIGKQISSHEEKIKTEKPIKDTTINYWRNEIEEKFKKIKKEDEKYLED